MLARPEGPKADTLGVFGSTAALKNGEEEGVLSLPKAPKPVAGLNTDGDV